MFLLHLLGKCGVTRRHGRNNSDFLAKSGILFSHMRNLPPASIIGGKQAREVKAADMDDLQAVIY